ncbi:hypothetical protein JF729_18550 [Mycobacterium intracellulare]|uniref:hypothetical protein n=1 Tax=Mycobacterium intracellulare TaxID=1767 RepID=UPI001CD9A8D0|nr:hypothetical protein [Mycobacterium intracellulare]MCA2249781.1 hypothetical protein [Mycobacterium intracellulare]
MSVRQVFGVEGFELAGNMPPMRELATPAGFAGVAVLIAALIVALSVMFAVWRASKRHRARIEQRERHHQELREDQRRAAGVQECRSLLRWVVETAGIEPATSEGASLGLGPELAVELLRGLRHDAEQLGDETLAKAAEVHLQQFALVLAQQGGSLAQYAAGSDALGDGKASAPVSPVERPTPDSAATVRPPGASDAPASASRSTGGRRRRQ